MSTPVNEFAVIFEEKNVVPPSGLYSTSIILLKLVPVKFVKLPVVRALVKSPKKTESILVPPAGRDCSPSMLSKAGGPASKLLTRFLLNSYATPAIVALKKIPGPVADTVITNEQPAADAPVGVKLTAPLLEGFPVPFNITFCGPVVVNEPDLLKVMPPAAAVIE